MTEIQVPNLINYPNHEHPLQLTDGMQIYPQFQGSWKCDNCHLQKTNAERPYHCQLCEFDLCIECALPIKHLRHPDHQLYRMHMSTVYPQYGGKWRCDGCDVTKNPEMAYHCFQDQFDICERCVKGQNLPIHRHPLKPVDAASLYNEPPGWWACNCCKRHGTEIPSRNSWHCSACEFDCCISCLRERKSPLHQHPLHLTDPLSVYQNYNGVWKCDICSREFSPDNPEPGRGLPYHCFECSFDVCYNCIRPSLEADNGHDIPMPSNMASNNHAQPARVPNSLHQPPTEISDDDNDEDDISIDNLDDSEKCLICVSRRRNATIVHGTTGHVCCCVRCAKTLKNQGKSCPICRAPIDLVIKQYNS